MTHPGTVSKKTSDRRHGPVCPGDSVRLGHRGLHAVNHRLDPLGGRRTNSQSSAQMRMRITRDPHCRFDGSFGPSARKSLLLERARCGIRGGETVLASPCRTSGVLVSLVFRRV